MNILLLNVPLRPKTPLKRFPLGLGYIATALCRTGYNIDILDIDLHELSANEVARALRRKRYDVVCLGTIVSGYRRVKEVCGIVREYHPHAKIIVGNTVASSITQILLTKTEADVAVLGEGDETIIELLDALSKEEPLDEIKGIVYRQDKMHQHGHLLVCQHNGVQPLLKRNPDRPVIQDLDQLPFVAFDLFDVEEYIAKSKLLVSDPLPISRETVRAMPMSTARGCLYSCTFCYHAFIGTGYRVRSPKHFVDEMAELQSKYGINYAILDDELTFFNKRQTFDFAETIIGSGLKFHWVANCRASLFNNEEDLEIILKLKQAGCHGLRYSLESADSRILKKMKKPLRLKGFEKQTELLHHAGLPAWTSVVIGYPDETPETIARTFDVCVDNRIFPSTGFLLPQPGSVMYEYANKHGYIKEEEEYLLGMGDRIDLHVNMTKMSDQELKRLTYAGMKRVNEVAAVSTLMFDLEYSGDRASAKRDVEHFVAQLSKWGGTKISWDEYAGNFDGVGVSGNLTIKSSKVRVTIKLGLMAKIAGAEPNSVSGLIEELKRSLNQEVRAQGTSPLSPQSLM